MNIVIWGAGRRGRRFADYVGREHVIGFIDRNESLQGKTVAGLPVFSYEEWKAKGRPGFLMVSPLYDQEICQGLLSDGIYEFSSLNDEPVEINIGDKGFSLEEIPLLQTLAGKRVGIYGTTYFSFMLADYLKERRCASVTRISHREPVLPHTADMMAYDIILVTVRKMEPVSYRYPNVRLENFWDFSYLPKYQHPELEQFRGCHNGERLFIVATGPSLRLEDLETLRRHGEKTMSVNMIYRSFNQTRWRPDYYVMCDANGIEEYGKELKELHLPGMFAGDNNRKFYHSKGTEHIHFYHMIHARMRDWPDVSDNIVKCVFGGGTVVLDCLQIAMYMGFHEIYLLGTDCDYQGAPQEKCNHFIKDYFHDDDRQPRTPFPLEETFLGYQAIRDYARRHDIQIFNATRGGKLEVFPRVAFDTLFDG